MGWDADEARGAAEAMTPEEIERAEREWEEYERERDQQDEDDMHTRPEGADQ